MACVETDERSTDSSVVCTDVPEACDLEREMSILEGFLAQKHDGRICDAGLVRWRFVFELPKERPEALDHGIEGADYYRATTACSSKKGRPRAITSRGY